MPYYRVAAAWAHDVLSELCARTACVYTRGSYHCVGLLGADEGSSATLIWTQWWMIQLSSGVWTRVLQQISTPWPVNASEVKRVSRRGNKQGNTFVCLFFTGEPAWKGQCVDNVDSGSISCCAAGASTLPALIMKNSLGARWPRLHTAEGVMMNDVKRNVSAADP